MTSSTRRTPGTWSDGTAYAGCWSSRSSRFRYGDGFTNSRALALQTCLAVVPFLPAVTGLAADIDDDRWARVYVVFRHPCDNGVLAAGNWRELTVGVISWALSPGWSGGLPGDVPTPVPVR